MAWRYQVSHSLPLRKIVKVDMETLRRMLYLARAVYE